MDKFYNGSKCIVHARQLDRDGKKDARDESA